MLFDLSLMQKVMESSQQLAKLSNKYRWLFLLLCFFADRIIYEWIDCSHIFFIIIFIKIMSFIQAQNQAEVEQQAWKKSSLYDLKSQVTLPKQNQQQITRVIQASHDVLKKLNDQQTQIMLEKHNAKLVQQNTYKIDQLVTIQNFSTRDLNSYSIMGDISEFVFQIIRNLIEIQSQIDPTTQKLVTINNNSIIDTVTLLLSSNNIWFQFNQIIGVFQNDIQKAAEIGGFVSSLFQKIYSKAQKLGFAIRMDKFMQAIFNQKILRKADYNQAAIIQTQAFQQVLKKNKQQKLTLPVGKFYKVKFVQLLKKKRQMYRKKQKPKFWKVLPQQKRPQLSQMVMKGIQGQLQQIKSGVVKAIDEGQDYQDMIKNDAGKSGSTKRIKKIRDK